MASDTDLLVGCVSSGELEHEEEEDEDELPGEVGDRDEAFE